MVSARRQPGTDRVLWQVTMDGHLNPADRPVGAELKTAIASLRGHIGA